MLSCPVSGWLFLFETQLKFEVSSILMMSNMSAAGKIIVAI